MSKLPRLTPIAACIVAAFALLPAIADAATVTLTVTSCHDSGPGSLRTAVFQANTYLDDVVIDLSHLTCQNSMISLTTGALASTKNYLILQGPGARKLQLIGDNTDRVITHNATQGIFIYDLGIGGGRIQNAQANGGCIYSSSSVTLLRSSVSYCSTLGTSGSNGGAIYAKSTVALTGGDNIYQNIAYSSGGTVNGGAIAAAQVFAFGSTISNNSTASPVGGGAGGGIWTPGLFAFGSTIDNNRANEGGGIFIPSNGSGTIWESTISGNEASQCGGGVYSKYQLNISNSTIAFNRALAQSTQRTCVGGGVYSGLAAKSVTLQSTIIANNRGGSSSADFASDFDASPGTGSTTNKISGSNNLVMVTDAGSRAPPSDSLHTDPQLLPLRGNGGGTRTQALAATSIAINRGNNGSSDTNDQRGAGFARVIGSSADIGAVEFNPDVIFENGFD